MDLPQLVFFRICHYLSNTKDLINLRLVDSNFRSNVDQFIEYLTNDYFLIWGFRMAKKPDHKIISNIDKTLPSVQNLFFNVGVCWKTQNEDFVSIVNLKNDHGFSFELPEYVDFDRSVFNCCQWHQIFTKRHYYLIASSKSLAMIFQFDKDMQLVKKSIKIAFKNRQSFPLFVEEFSHLFDSNKTELQSMNRTIFFGDQMRSIFLKGSQLVIRYVEPIADSKEYEIEEHTFNVNSKYFSCSDVQVLSNLNKDAILLRGRTYFFIRLRKIVQCWGWDDLLFVDQYQRIWFRGRSYNYLYDVKLDKIFIIKSMKYNFLFSHCTINQIDNMLYICSKDKNIFRDISTIQLKPLENQLDKENVQNKIKIFDADASGFYTPI